MLPTLSPAPTTTLLHYGPGPGRSALCGAIIPQPARIADDAPVAERCPQCDGAVLLADFLGLQEGRPIPVRRPVDLYRGDDGIVRRSH